MVMIRVLHYGITTNDILLSFPGRIHTATKINLAIAEGIYKGLKEVGERVFSIIF